MSKCSFIVDLAPEEVMHKIRRGEEADLVHEEFYDLGDGRYQGTLVFEKYFMRVSSRVALVILVHNFFGKTQVTALSTGSSQSILFKFDWGASEDFVYSVKSLLETYIVEEIEEK